MTTGPPFPLSEIDLDESENQDEQIKSLNDALNYMKSQVWELIRDVYEEKIGGASLGDVFSITGDVLTIELATPSGLTKSGNELAVDALSTGGLQTATTGLSIKLVSTGGLETGASGLGINLDGGSLTLSADGIKITDPFTPGEITLDNDGLHLRDTDASHVLTIKPGSDLSADRTFEIITGDAGRAITLNGNPTLDDWFDQAVKQASSPTFAGLTTTAGRIRNTTRYTTTQAIPTTDDVVFCNTDGGAWTATLPAGAEGQTFEIFNSGSGANNLTVAPNGAEHLFGSNTNFVLHDGEKLIITYNTTDGWY